MLSILLLLRRRAPRAAVLLGTLSAVTCLSATAAAPTLESDVIALVNQARTTGRQKPLALDPVLARAATVLASDEAGRKNGFPNDEPDLKPAEEYVRASSQAAGVPVRYNVVTETAWFSRPPLTKDKIADALRRDATNRQTLTAPRFTHVGVGRAKADDGTEWLVVVCGGNETPAPAALTRAVPARPVAAKPAPGKTAPARATPAGKAPKRTKN